MESDNIQSSQGVTLVGAGLPMPEDIAEAVNIAPTLVAADGGANFCIAAGFRPDAVIGDFDSVDGCHADALSDSILIRIAEQETTDLEKCLYSLRAPLVIGCGFLGERTDHALAAMSALLRYRDQRAILLGEGDLVFHWPESLELELPSGMPVSFFPLAPLRGVASEGLEWPVAGIDFAPGARIGTSNRATGGRMQAAFDGPGMLAVLPFAALDAAVAALSTRAG